MEVEGSTLDPRFQCTNACEAGDHQKNTTAQQGVKGARAFHPSFLEENVPPTPTPTHIHTQTHTHTRTHKHTNTHTQTFTHTHSHTHTLYTYTYIHYNAHT